MSRNLTRMKTLVIGITLLSVTLLLPRCGLIATHQHHDGPPLPDSEVAIIDGGTSSTEYTTVVMIDKKPLHEMKVVKGTYGSVAKFVRVKPGVHEFELSHRKANPEEEGALNISGSYHMTSTYQIEVKKGHTYKISRIKIASSMWLRFEDLCHPSRRAVELKQGVVNHIEE